MRVALELVWGSTENGVTAQEPPESPANDPLLVGVPPEYHGILKALAKIQQKDGKTPTERKAERYWSHMQAEARGEIWRATHGKPTSPDPLSPKQYGV